MIKFNPTYKLSIFNMDGDIVEVVYPITIEFDTYKDATTVNANQGSFKIKGLAKQTRDFIRQDYFDYTLGVKNKVKMIKFEAGYQDNITTLYTGDIMTAFSERNGNEIITNIICQDGMYASYNSYMNLEISKGATMKTVFESAMNSLQTNGLSKGVVDTDLTNQPTKKTYSEPAMNVLINEMGAYIEDGKVYALNDNTALINPEIAVIDASSGLLDSPKIENERMSFETIFEPRLKLSQVIEIISELNPDFNGYYKVMSIRHSGVISETQSGGAKTHISVIRGYVKTLDYK